MRELGAHVLCNVDDGVEDLRRVGGVGGLQRALPGRTGRHLQVSVIINATVCLSALPSRTGQYLQVSVIINATVCLSVS